MLFQCLEELDDHWIEADSRPPLVGPTTTAWRSLVSTRAAPLKSISYGHRDPKADRKRQELAAACLGPSQAFLAANIYSVLMFSKSSECKP